MYNLLLDTKFTNKNNNWKYNNCEYKDGYLISSEKVFGIEQELVLPDPTKLYLRFNYKVLTSCIREVKVGIQIKDRLEIDKRLPKINKLQKLSVVCDSKEEKINVHLIFESTEKVNKVFIEKPILVDLNLLHKSTWLKLILDRTVCYIDGYNYTNIYPRSELVALSRDIQPLNPEEAKIGSIISVNETKSVKINAKFNDNTYYLAKLDFEEINRYGNISFKYGVLKSKRVKDQLYLVFKANSFIDLKLEVEPKEKLDYKVNLKHIMIVDMTSTSLDKTDLPYLPFI